MAETGQAGGSLEFRVGSLESVVGIAVLIRVIKKQFWRSRIYDYPIPLIENLLKWLQLLQK
jgi:hypothetical protein